MIIDILYALPIMIALFFLIQAAVLQGVLSIKALRPTNIENRVILSLSKRVGVSVMIAFAALAVRGLFPDVKYPWVAVIGILLLGVFISIAWGWGMYASIKRFRSLRNRARKQS